MEEQWQCPGQQNIVIIAKPDIGSGCRAEPAVPGCADTRILLGDHPDPCILTGYFMTNGGCPIGGAIIHQYKFESFHILRQNRGRCSSQRRFCVKERYNQLIRVPTLRSYLSFCFFMPRYNRPYGNGPGKSFCKKPIFQRDSAKSRFISTGWKI